MNEKEKQIIFDEIDRLVQECKSGNEFRIKHELLEMKEFIKNMDNLKLTENDEKEIDSAAEENSKEYYCSALETLNETGICDGCENVKLAFKAGVKWILSQGITVKGKLLDGFLYTHFGDWFFDMKEKTRIEGAPTECDAIDVTVQIR